VGLQSKSFDPDTYTIDFNGQPALASANFDERQAVLSLKVSIPMSPNNGPRNRIIQAPSICPPQALVSSGEMASLLAAPDQPDRFWSTAMAITPLTRLSGFLVPILPSSLLDILPFYKSLPCEELEWARPLLI